MLRRRSAQDTAPGAPTAEAAAVMLSGLEDVPFGTLVGRLATSLASRIDLGTLGTGRVTLEIVVVGDDHASASTVVVDRRDGVTLDPTATADATLTWESSDDVIAVERGELLLMSVLRVGRLAIDARTIDRVALLHALRPSALGADYLLEESVRRLVVSAANDGKAKDLLKTARQIGVGDVLGSYARAQAEALTLAGFHRQSPGTSLSWMVLDGDHRHEVRVQMTEEACVVSRQQDGSPDWSMKWTGTVPFVRYIARKLNFRDALGDGSCTISGDLDLGNRFYAYVNRHGV